MTVSHHLLRRTARKRKKYIERLAKTAQDPMNSDCMYARARLTDFGLPRSFDGPVRVEPTKRGPWRYVVIATTAWQEATRL